MICSTVSYASKLNEDISLIEKQTSGRIGVSVWDTQTDERWDYRGDERFPLMSTFKTLACATMLSDMDSGKLNKNHHNTDTAAIIIHTKFRTVFMNITLKLTTTLV
ncbi:hypothetical protein BMI84_16930 [Vibrio parahaemolyticus]|nr:hypothetical protein BMI84_16930 [Vibrio parahaemolyticus]